MIFINRYGWRGLAASAGSLVQISSVTIASLYGHYDLDPVINLKIGHPETLEL